MLFALAIALHPLDRPTYLMSDFRAFYCAGAAIAHGANPYLEEPLRSCEVAAGPPYEPAPLRSIAMPAPLPPYALLLFVPFAALPFALAATIYSVAMIVAMTLAAGLFARVAGVSRLWLDLAFAAIAGLVMYYVGQPVPVVFLALAVAAAALRNGRWTSAAACAVAASIEPHLALPALVAMFAAAPRTRVPIAIFAGVVAAVAVLAVGGPTALSYLRDVVPAHALANAYEWQFSLTSILTSLGVAAEPSVRAGEVMYGVMALLGIVAAYRLWRATGDRAVLVLVPPAFAVFGGVHVHFQQLLVAFPAMFYVYARFPERRSLAAIGIALAMLPWNVIGSSMLIGVAPLLAGVFAALTMNRRRGLAVAACAAVIALSVIVLASVGFGPQIVDFVGAITPPGALAETSWGEYSRAVLARGSPLLQWIRIPTLVGLACGLMAIAGAACAPAQRPLGGPSPTLVLAA